MDLSKGQAVKFTKHELDQVWSLLGEEFYIDDNDQEPKEDDELPPSTVITATYGPVRWQGKLGELSSGELEPAQFANHPLLKPSDVAGQDLDVDITTLIKRWRKNQQTVVLAIEVPRESEAAVVEFLKTIKGKIVK